MEIFSDQIRINKSAQQVSTCADRWFSVDMAPGYQVLENLTTKNNADKIRRLMDLMIGSKDQLTAADSFDSGTCKDKLYAPDFIENPLILLKENSILESGC